MPETALPQTALIGLVGGLGPPATMYYYEALLAESARRGYSLRLLINQADVSFVLDAAAREDTGSMAAYLAARMNELTRAGAGLLAIGAVTPHMCMPELAALVNTPVVDIATLTARHVRRRGFTRVAMIGTRATVQSRLFGHLDGLACTPQPSEIDTAQDLYLTIARQGSVAFSVAAGLRQIALDYTTNANAQAIILAGTELALVPLETWQGIEIIDCAGLHVQAILDQAHP